MDESDMQGLSDQDIEQLVQQMGATSAIPEKNDALAQQIKLAQALRAGPNMPQGQMVGKVYVGPNALQDLSAIGNNYIGNQMAQQGINQMQANAGQQQDARTAYMKLLSQALRNRQSQVPSQSMNPAEGMDYQDIAAGMA